MHFNADELAEISGRLSGDHGHFPSSNLVNYGQTVILKPGARTFTGVLLSGEAVSELLGEDYEVFPVTLSYLPDVSSDGLDRVPVEASDLEAAIDALPEDDDAFGAKGGAIRKRYNRLLGRYRRFAVKASRKRSPKSMARAERLLSRLRSIFLKIQERGIDTEGLVRPDEAARQVAAMLSEAELTERAVPTVPNVSTPFDMPSGPPTFTVEQREADAELRQDVRADTPGYLFGSSEHDYFGIEEDVLPSEYEALVSEAERLDDRIEDADEVEAFGATGDAIRGKYQRLANRYRRFAAKAYRKGTPKLRAKAERLLSRVRKIYLKMQEKGLEVEGLTRPDELAEETEVFVLEAEVSSRATPGAPKKSAKSSKKSKRSKKKDEGEDEPSSEENEDEEGSSNMFGFEGTNFDFIDNEEEIVFGLQQTIQEVREAMGMDDDLDLLDDELNVMEDDSDRVREELEALDDMDDDDFGDDDFGDDDEDEDDEDDETSVKDVREARREARIAKAERDAAKAELARARAERRLSKISGEDDEDEGDSDLDEDEDKPAKAKKAKGKSKAKGGDEGEDNEEEGEEDGDLVASQRAKLSRAIKQVRSLLSDKQSSELLADTRGTLQEAGKLLSTLNFKARRGAKNGGIVYGRLRPVPAGGKADGITVVAIRRRNRNPQAAKVQAFAGSFGMASDGHLLDVYATDFLDRSEGFDALESMEAIRDYTGPNDFVYGAEDMMGARLFQTRGRELRQQMPAMRSKRLLKVAANPYRSRRSRRAAMQELRQRHAARMGAEEQQAEEIGYLFVTRGRELVQQMPELRSYRLYNIFSNPYRSERVRREALETLAERFASEQFGDDYGRMFRVRGRKAVALTPYASSRKLMEVASNPYRSSRVRAAAAAELAERHAERQGLPAPVAVVPNPISPQIVVQPTPITPATAPVTASIATPAPAPAPVPAPAPAPAASGPVYVPVANPAFSQPPAAYFQDQQALEREVAARAPALYGEWYPAEEDYGRAVGPDAYGSFAVQPYPYGDAAPLPAPRRAGPEVFA